MTQKDKIIGMFLGAFIGDTLGKPVEMWKQDKIKETFGRLATIIKPSGHKFFPADEAGTWSDDAQLTEKVAKGLVLSNGVENLTEALNAQVKMHIEAFAENTNGWGRSTRESIRRLCNGVHWSKSGECSESTGKGNGICMKISPVAGLTFLRNDEDTYGLTVDFVTDLALMTHRTSVAVSSGLAMMQAAYACLWGDPKTFEEEIPVFISDIVAASSIGTVILPETLDNDKFPDRLELLNNHKEYDTQRIINEFVGSCYCYNSLPFTLMFFVKNPMSIETLYDVVNAGGDTDSNGSMMGALLGALHGPNIFPDHLRDGLDVKQKQTMLETANKFHETFKRN